MLCPHGAVRLGRLAPMLNRCARMGVWGLVGAWGVWWALLPQLVSTFITSGGDPGLTPTPGAGGRGCAQHGEVTADAPGRRDWSGYCMSATRRRAEAGGPSIAQNDLPSEGGRRRNLLALSPRHGRPAVPFTVGGTEAPR